MKKSLLFFCALLMLGVSGAWADGLLVSTTESASAEYQYKIFCRNASTYYLGNTTNATNSGADYGLFAFFADNSGDYTNGYYIYSIFEGKWVSFTAAASYTEGQDKITLVDDKPTVPWNIAADDTNNKYYDIRPFKTDKTVANMAWNWHGGASYNTSHTMGFYSYTDGNSGWGIILAGGSGSPVADRKVVALYNRDTNNDEYPITPNSGVIVAGSTTADAQLFVLKQNGIDSNGEAQYNLMKAEADGNYLTTPGSPTSSVYGTSPTNYLLINQSCSFISNYTETNSDFATSPYYNLIASNAQYRSLHSNNTGANMNGWSTDSPKIYVAYGAKNSWNNLWNVKEQAYTAWQVVMSGATSGTVTYNGSALISGGTATQSNNGMFVLSATPSASDFTASVVDGYLSDPTITIDNDRKIIKVVYTSYTATYNTIVNTLSTAPEGLGYPTSQARGALSTAISAFDESAKASSNLAALNTAFNTFKASVVLPDEGKIYTLQSYIKSKAGHELSYFVNDDGTLTISEEPSATALNNLWIVCKSSNGTVTLQSAADRTKYIVYTSFTLNATGSDWTLSCGTEWPYISLYNGTLTRYIACNGSNQFGTAGGNNYYASAKTQYSGWSTDFKFVESEDYALYKVKILYPQGQAASTVTYNENAYSNGTEFIAPTTLTTAALTASAIDGYTPNILIDGDIIYVNYSTTYTSADTWNYDSSPWSVLHDVPSEIIPDSYRYNTKRINIPTTYNSTVAVSFAYTSGSYRIDLAGVDLINPSTGEVVKGDYHDGYSGNEQSNKDYTINNVAPGDYILRYISWGSTTSSAGNISVSIVPDHGFYRLKGKTSDKYLAAGFASNSKFAMTTATDATTIFYYDGTKLTNLSSGMCNGVTASSWAWVVGEGASTVTFQDGLISRGYAIQTSDANFYDNGDNTNSADRGSSVSISSSTDDRYCSWELIGITTLPIKISSVGYATLYSPVALTIPSGITAYKAVEDGVQLTLESIGSEGDVIPANTGVILEGSEGSYDFDITTTEETVTGNVLTGTIAAIVKPATAYYLSNGDKGLGFYKGGSASNMVGFKAYYDPGASVKEFVPFGFGDATGIKAIENGQLAIDGVEIYNIAGQRVSKLQRGVNIVNGKKVLVK